MIDVKNKTCEHPKCKIIPNFNYEFELKGVYCFEHKKEKMVNVISKTCQYLGCKTQPAFNYENENEIKFCGKHKLNGMINIKTKTCQHQGCKILPSFNYENETKAKFCNNHKEENMINIISKTCQHLECKTRPNFNYENETKGVYCFEHKKEEMINVKDKTCEHQGCKTRANFNYENETKATYCFEHKKEEMVNVKSKKCKANFCLGTKANVKYKGYCSNCYQNLFPLDPLSYQIRCKTKEIAVRDYINENFEGFQHDKPLFTGNCDCTSRRRIDHRILIGNTLLCVETDENQHKSYDKKDEEIRYDDLYMLHSGKFVFIRFNPDKYINSKNKSVNPMLYTRLPILKEEIEKQMDRIKKEENTELLEIIKLYYDGYN